MPVFSCRGIAFGQGRPKICVPLTPASPQELEGQLAALSAVPYDLVEWRVDYLPPDPDLLSLYPRIRGAIGEAPLLLTFRSAREGGLRTLDPQAYTALYRNILDAGAADLIDLEWEMGPSVWRPLMDEAARKGVLCVLSYHNFQETPDLEALEDLMGRLGEASPDFAKVAFMPRSAQDVTNLLSASEKFGRQCPRTLWITVSMGDLGKISRLAGSITGSAITFGSAARASAPGQIPAETLKQMLELLELPQNQDLL